jgi:hypothetical protein
MLCGTYIFHQYCTLCSVPVFTLLYLSLGPRLALIFPWKYFIVKKCLRLSKFNFEIPLEFRAFISGL